MRKCKSILLAASDVVLLLASLIAACYFTGTFAILKEANFLLVSLFVVVQIGVFVRFGLYRAVLRYASIDFLITVLKAVSVASLAMVFVLYLLQVHFPPRLIFVDWLLTVFLIGGSRLAVRYYFELRSRWQKGRRVLIYGAGDMGVLAFRQLNMNKAVFYSPVGFLDDDTSKKGKVISGIKVAGGFEELDDAIDRLKVEEVLVAIAELSSEKLGDIVKKCRQKNVACRIIPCFSRLLDIEPEIRNVELADLMRRPPKDLDKEAIKRYLEQKTILVTGAAGSIGSEIVKQCLKYDPRRIIAMDRSEFGLYTLQEELDGNGGIPPTSATTTRRTEKKVGHPERGSPSPLPSPQRGEGDDLTPRHYHAGGQATLSLKGEGNDVHIDYLLCDVTDKDGLDIIFNRFRPEIVFHSAAYKHVPMLEFNPAEAIKNNIGSTKGLCELADKYNVKSFVMISTDKAVKPSSVMGATKRVCEMIVQNFDSKSAGTFVSVRFGNVLGSSGSVIPKFIEQIKKGGPVTVTHPDATRYFMLIDEAAQLVLQASAIGKGREIFVLDMGRPVRITDMAEDLIYLMGRQPHKDIKIEFTGLRPGEKVHEELFNSEIEKATRFREITVAKPKVVDKEWLEQKVDMLLKYAERADKEGVLNTMEEIISDGHPLYFLPSHGNKNAPILPLD